MHTPTVDAYEEYSANGRLMKKGTCLECGILKTQFIRDYYA